MLMSHCPLPVETEEEWMEGWKSAGGAGGEEGGETA